MAASAMNGRSQNGDTPKDPHVSKRLDLSCSTLGFSPPPCGVQIKFLPGQEGRWTLVALTPPAQPPNVARWLEDYGPASIQIASGLAPKVLHASFDELPKDWERMLEAVEVQFVELTPEGAASLFAHGTPDRIERFVETLEDNRPDQPDALEIRSREARMDTEDDALTSRQMEILSRAVALGYYEIPHNLTLRELADRLDLSVGTVSELLRRAEAKIITSHVDSWVESRWNGEAKVDSMETFEPLERAST